MYDRLKKEIDRLDAEIDRTGSRQEYEKFEQEVEEFEAAVKKGLLDAGLMTKDGVFDGKIGVAVFFKRLLDALDGAPNQKSKNLTIMCIIRALGEELGQGKLS